MCRRCPICRGYERLVGLICRWFGHLPTDEDDNHRECRRCHAALRHWPDRDTCIDPDCVWRLFRVCSSGRGVGE